MEPRLVVALMRVGCQHDGGEGLEVVVDLVELVRCERAEGWSCEPVGECFDPQPRGAEA